MDHKSYFNTLIDINQHHGYSENAKSYYAP